MVQYLKERWNEVKYEAGAEVVLCGRNPVVARVAAVFTVLRFEFCRIVVCRVVDHKWVDESYGGPDSGCMAGHCERCGYGFHHQLY